MIWDWYNSITIEFPKVIKLINFLGNTPYRSCRLTTKIWVETNDDAPGTYNTNSQTKLKTSMLKSILCSYSDAYILVKGMIKVRNTAGAGQSANIKDNNAAIEIFK